MHKEPVEKRRWLSEERFLHALNYCMLLPGPEAQQLATYIGWLMHRTIGGIVAGALFVIPSVFIMLVLSALYASFGRFPLVNGVLDGFKGVVVAIVVEALFKISKRALKREVHYGIAALAFFSIYFLHVPFPFIVLGAAGAGLIGIRYLPNVFLPPTENPLEPIGAKHKTVIMDDAEPPEHTLPNRRRFVNTIAIGIAFWSLPFVGLIAWRGFDSLHTQEYRFFSLSALVTFGGAYAVVAYVTQTVTTAPFNWITPTQAVDGLALAETTPGPLIMVLQFVGFMAGWNNPPDGMSQLTGGIIGGLITTYATFFAVVFIYIFRSTLYRKTSW